MKFCKYTCGSIFLAFLLAACEPAFMMTEETVESPADAVIAKPGPQTTQSIIRYDSIVHPEKSKYGMVVSQEALASEIGGRILAQGGNATDASIAVGFALAVTLPRAGNIGAGGLSLSYSKSENKVRFIDFREVAPLAATKEMYWDEEGGVNKAKLQFSHASAAVPGTIAGFAYMHETSGSMPWPALILPAIKLAEEGFIVTHDLSTSLGDLAARSPDVLASLAPYYPDGNVPMAGSKLVLKDLAHTLRLLADNGADVFYRGQLADIISDDMAKHDGLITHADLKAYRVIERAPVRGTYRGFDIVSSPPPSSGGIHIIQMLNILERFPLKEWGHNSSKTIHVVVESMKRAYADRSVYLGDTDFQDVPITGLISKAYAENMSKQISLDKVTPSSEIHEGKPAIYESPDTTHFTIADNYGNVVTTTYTLNYSYGSRRMIEGTGIILNNQMDDFAARPGIPNAYGLVGGAANAIEPGKRPLSSMSPTIIMKDGDWVLATGSPGGSRIITTVLQVVMNYIDHDMNVAEASVAPRFHHQWLPDILRVEPGFSSDTLTILEDMDYTISRNDATMGSVQSIANEEGLLLGYSDTRRPGAKAVALTAIPILNPNDAVADAKPAREFAE